jgi:predicted HicB family RNase H-like nuclease
MMEYKGYTGQITAVDEKQGLIHGRVAGLIDVVTFEGATFEELIQAFHDSVEDYLDFCEERKKAPEKPFSGKFLVRLAPELHRQAALAARRAGESLNAWVAAAIKAQLDRGGTGARRPALNTEGLDTKTLLYVLERVETKPPVIPGRLGEPPYPMTVEPDPYRAAIICTLIDRMKELEAEKEKSEKGH